MSSSGSSVEVLHTKDTRVSVTKDVRSLSHNAVHVNYIIDFLEGNFHLNKKPSPNKHNFKIIVFRLSTLMKNATV